jgi:hypothetical protein
MTLRVKPRLFRRALAVVAGALMTGGVLVSGATPASAATCATAGHSYLTQPGRFFFSGFEGDQRYGVPALYTFSFDAFSLGGNGIRPGTSVRFEVTDRATGEPANILSGGRSSYITGAARLNCVVNEEGTGILAPVGTYRVTAYYTAGNTNAYVADPVVDIVVQPSAPAPEPEPEPFWNDYFWGW